MTTPLQVTILGCGGSGGVPLATGWWGACDPANPKNRRRRASIAVQSATTCLVVDTGPDFREQTLENNIKRVDAVLYTHAHADHVNGMDDVRYLTLLQKQNMPIYADAATLAEQQNRFAHLFTDSADGFYPTCLNPTVLKPFEPVTHGDISFTPIPQFHGVAGASLAFRFGNFCYSTDVSGLTDAALEAIKGVDVWVLDGGQIGSDFNNIHPTWDMVEAWQEKVQAKRVYLTHLTPRIDYETLNANTPPHFEPAYDGLVLNVAGA